MHEMYINACRVCRNVQKCHLQFLKQNDVADLVLLVFRLLGLPELFLSRVATHGANLEQAV